MRFPCLVSFLGTHIICHFFLWGYLKQQAFARRPRTFIELEDVVTVHEIRAIQPDMLTRVKEHFRKRIDVCNRVNT